MTIQFSPWDTMGIFPLFSEKQVTITAKGDTLVVADPKRFFLAVFNQNASSQLQISTSSNPATGQGLPVNNSNFGIILTLDVWGPLVTQQWFGNPGVGAVTTTVWTYSAIEWPSGLKNGVQLPWEREDGKVKQLAIDREQRAGKALRALLKKYNLAIPGWLGTGGNGNGN